MTDAEALQLTRDKIAERAWEIWVELGSRFFFQIAVLSGSIVALLIPFVQSLQPVLKARYYFVTCTFLLVCAIAASLLRNFLFALSNLENAKYQTGELREKPSRECWIMCMQFFAIGTFLLGMLVAVLFVYVNLDMV